MKQVVVVGAGVAGLTCALRLKEHGIESIVLEAGDAVGGRIRTDEVEGFKLDRGFQVMLSAYPACQRYLDYAALNLTAFDPGAVVHTSGGWQRVVDPRRRWTEAWPTLRSDVGTFADKLRVLKWALAARKSPVEFPDAGEEQSSLAYLRQRGFSERMIQRFWRPWLSGIFLEPELETSQRMADFVFGMFARGDAVIPREGMQAIPVQLASKLPPESVRLGQAVAALEPGAVILADGARIAGGAIVLAVDGSTAYQLGAINTPPQWRESRCIYYAAPKPPFADALLRLNGESTGVVNHLAALDQVNPSYAPAGQSLIMAGIRPGDLREDAAIEGEAQTQLRFWFGDQVDSWRVLRHDRVKRALPARGPLNPQSAEVKHSRVFRCGDFLRHPSLQGAMESGEVAADAVTERFEREG
ncbi:FAD-dependent oxidoreductase [Opitutaceae bacterium]|nr:FAD-dependent oxidoreductase [Opitutaceae bacterium]